MLLKDKQVIYITTPRTEIMHGQSITSWEKLRKIYANVQYMSNEDEQREFGTVTNSIIIIRISGYVDKDVVKGIESKDGIYLKKPNHLNIEYVPDENGEELPDLQYPAPDYVIFEIKSAYVTAKNDPHKFTSTLKNPVTVKARKTSPSEVYNEGKRK